MMILLMRNLIAVITVGDDRYAFTILTVSGDIGSEQRYAISRLSSVVVCLLTEGLVNGLRCRCSC